jgi:hypothetical protein
VLDLHCCMLLLLLLLLLPHRLAATTPQRYGLSQCATTAAARSPSKLTPRTQSTS